MFMDFRDQTPPPRWTPPPPARPPKLSQAEERNLTRLILAFLLFSLLAPIGGSTVVIGVRAAWQALF
ncbi:hypothetical protein SAMN06297144_2814 [Sphingomonas guangdongensis]|uniref:Uncharacterized protein n=1 Tax=Sphingomonas guangdongensis TaxID=1141890 RepID=A0A285R1N1_9SPHN|nr:hypothetical protein [Sphingomonas guangdongensis]SOB87678.1 hypothetical protein SAMN06297144_2814 [Sphingomonas guangdongensis]